MKSTSKSTFLSGIMVRKDIWGLVEYSAWRVFEQNLKWNFGRSQRLSYFSCFIFIAEIQSIAEPVNLERSLPLAPVSLLIPERDVMTHFLSLSPSNSDAYHIWPPCCRPLQSAAAVNLQEHCAPPFSAPKHIWLITPVILNNLSSLWQ